jgi:energy-coupling factor transport system ATP-binding protein
LDGTAQEESSTRYRPEPWQRGDTFVTVAAGAAVLGLILLAAREPGALGYYPYPNATFPPLSIAPLVAVTFLAAPALVVGPSTQVRPRLAPQQEPRSSAAFRAGEEAGTARPRSARRHPLEDVAKGRVLLEAVRFTYPEAVRPALDGVALRVDPGERVLLGGVSGSGKSTLLRVINGLVPHFYGGRFGGRAFVSGADTRTSSPQGLAASVGTVFQDLPARFLTGAVEDEIAFSLELAQVDARRIPARVAEISERMGVTRLGDRRLERLSAGEQARLAVAAAAARRPDILLLDEPVTHIDPAGAAAAVEWVCQLSQEEGVTVLVAEHRDENWQDAAQRVVQLGGGRLWLEQGLADSAPGAEPELAEFVGRVSPTTLVARNLRLNLDGVGVLQGADIAVRPGELLALVGRNGSGKTTLLRCLVGLARPDAGEILLNGGSVKGRSLKEMARSIGYVPQAPSSTLFADTVEDEIGQTLASRGTGAAPGEVGRWLAAFGLTLLAGSYPRDLSAGERQRVALAAILAGLPPIVLLDEPTRGMDRRRMAWLGRGLQRLCRAGCAVVVATHDVAFVAEYASHAAMLAAGRIIAEGNPRLVLESDSAFAQALARWRTHRRTAGRPEEEMDGRRQPGEEDLADR